MYADALQLTGMQAFSFQLFVLCALWTNQASFISLRQALISRTVFCRSDGIGSRNSYLLFLGCSGPNSRFYSQIMSFIKSKKGLCPLKRIAAIKLMNS